MGASESVLKAMRKYVNSEKGKATRKAYFSKNKTFFVEYNKLYLRNRKLKFKRLGLCSSCGKKREDEFRKTCRKCRAYQTFCNRRRRSGR